MEKQISITKIKIRHSQILLFLNCSKKPETLQGELRFQNAWLNFCHPVAFYPVGKSLVCPINTDKLENYDGSLAAYAFLCFSADILCEMKKLFSFLWEALLTAFFCAAAAGRNRII